MKKLPENVRSNSREYRKYYPILQIIKLQNIFKYDLIKSIEIVSNSVNIYVLKSTLKFILDFFEISDISEISNFEISEISDISQREKFEFQREKFEFQRGESENFKNFKNFEDFYKFLKSKHSFRQIKRNLKTFTTKERYKEIYEKCRETTFKNNGYYSSFECQEVQNKVKDTFLKKYGCKSNGKTEKTDKKSVKKPTIKKTKKFIKEFKEINKLELFNLIKSNNKISDTENIDIFLPDNNLAIEYNKLLYHSQGHSNNLDFHQLEKDLRHFDKLKLLESRNIQLFNIFEGEDLDLWLSMIHNKLGLNKRIFARKCIIKELESNEIKNFLNENHIQGYIPSRINLGLFYNFKNSSLEEDFELVQVMTFSKSRYTRDIEYELIRLCGLKGYSIIGGASKLLKYFETKYKPKSIVSFANRRFSNGDIYKKLGFDFVENTNPNYFYFKTGDTQLYSRVQFQKHKLKNKLEIFDPELSETDNMFNNGYRRIYDCGNMKFIKYLNS